MTVLPDQKKRSDADGHRHEYGGFTQRIETPEVD